MTKDRKNKRPEKPNIYEQARIALLSDVKNAVEQHEAAFARSADVIFQNQRILQAANIQLDEQFAAMLKILFTRINAIADVFNQLDLEVAQPDGTRKSLRIDPITYQYVNEVLADFDKLKTIPGYAEHFREWYEGASADDLVKQYGQREVVKSLDMSYYPEDATIFGGDYAGSQNEPHSEIPEPAGESKSVEGQVHEVQHGHSSESEPRDGEEGQLLH